MNRPPSDQREDRARGCLLGLAVGEALGTTLEFRPRDSYPPLTDMIGGGPFGLAAGEWTDDTSMALCLADSLIENGDLDETDLMRRFVRWWRNGENSVTGWLFEAAIEMLLARLSGSEGRKLNLFRKVIGGREVAISFHEHSSDEQDRVVWRDYLRHPLWHYPFPVRTAD
jgi:ADP-ribosylglycohydrolase